MWNRPGDPYRNHLIALCFKASLGFLGLCVFVITGEKVAVLFFELSVFPKINGVIISVLIIIVIFAFLALATGIYLAYLEIVGIKSLGTEINFLFYPKGAAPKMDIIKQVTKLPHDCAVALFEIRNNPDSKISVTAYVGSDTVRIVGQASRTVLLRGNHSPIILILDPNGCEVAAVSCLNIESIKIILANEPDT